MTSDVKMVKYGGGGLLLFFEPLTKGSRGLSYIFIFTLHPSTFIAVDDPTLLHHGVLIFRFHQEVLDGSPSLEVYLHTRQDLRKPGLVPGKSLSLAQNYVFCFEETLIYKSFFFLTC